MRTLTIAIVAGGMLFTLSPGAWADSTIVAQGPAGSGEKTGSSQSKMPAKGALGAVRVRGTIAAIDKKTHTVTIKGPEGGTETIAAKDPKNLEAVKVGDMVEVTYTQALAISLDKPAN